MNIQITCKYCSSSIEVPLKWAQDNGRIFCGGCCKSFDVAIEMGVDLAKEDDKTVVTEIVNKDSEPFPLDPNIKVDELVNIDTPAEDNEWDFYDGLPF